MYVGNRRRGNVRMNIDETIVNGVPVTLITGRIDGATASTCEEIVLTRLQDGRAAMVLDLHGVDYLSSAGIRVLVMVFKRANAGRIPIALSRPQDHVVEILEIAGLDDVLEAHPSIEAAVAALS